MALTITQEPQDITPAYNDQYITILSDKIAESGFYYEVEVNVGGDTFNYKVYARPDGYMVFNAKEIVKNYIERTFDPTITTVGEEQNKSVSVSINVLEYYDGTTTGHDSVNVTYIAWDACYKEEDFATFDYLDIVDGTATSLLGPNATEFSYPDNRITLDTDLWCHFFNMSSDRITFSVYDANSVLQSTFDLTYTTASPLYINYVNIGAKTLMAQSPAIVPQVGWGVEVAVIDGTSTIFETSYTFTDICTKYTKYRLYYLKRNGSIGYFHFEMKSNESVDKVTNSVRLPKNKMVSGVYTYNSYDREKHIVSTQTTKKISLNTDWITESQSIALDELFDSPIVWLHDGTTYKAVDITDKTYNYNKHVNNKLFTLSLTCEYSVQETRQRGL